MANPIDLVTAERAALNPALAKVATASPDTLAALITAASESICRYCHRQFKLQSYTHYLSGAGQPYDELFLREIPVVSISRFAGNPTKVMWISNADKTTNQRATVATTATGITLTRVASGVATTNTITYASAVTLEALQTVISGLGGGWTTMLNPEYRLYASADLRPLQGAMTALSGGAALELYTEDLPFEQWRLDAGSGRLSGHFPQGNMNIRVDYVAGYATIPENVQQACVQLAADLSSINKRDQTVQSVKIGPFAKTFGDANKTLLQSPTIKSLLSTYIDHAKVVGL
jgi:hypothetical protein